MKVRELLIIGLTSLTILLSGLILTPQRSINAGGVPHVVSYVNNEKYGYGSVIARKLDHQVRLTTPHQLVRDHQLNTVDSDYHQTYKVTDQNHNLIIGPYDRRVVFQRRHVRFQNSYSHQIRNRKRFRNFEKCRNHHQYYRRKLRFCKAFKHRKYVLRKHSRTNHLYLLMKRWLRSKYYSRYLPMQARYRYLVKNENNSSVSLSKYRQEVLDWLNYCRNYIYNLNPVTLNDSFNQHAQYDDERGTDPEISTSTVGPQEVIDNYLTDEYDVDDDNRAGHRDSILNPSADYAGIGRSSAGNTIYFDWGLDNDSDGKPETEVGYPCGPVFPYNDAVNGEYWSWQFFENPYEEGNNYPAETHIKVHDDTVGRNVNVSNVHDFANEVYYNVRVSQLRRYHRYTVDLKAYVSEDKQPNKHINYSFFLV